MPEEPILILQKAPEKEIGWPPSHQGGHPKNESLKNQFRRLIQKTYTEYLEVKRMS